MKLPIPDDWNGQAWQCVQIQWPDSPLWQAMLHGWLSQFKRGRLWDETTGELLAVMAIGAEIWYRNTPLTTCDGETLPITPGQEPGDDADHPGQAAGGCFEDCEETMPCIDLSSMIDIHDGQLWVLNSCCEWVSIGSLAGQVEELPDDVFEPPGAPAPTYYACGKAAAAKTIVRDVATAIWEQFDTEPWKWVSEVEQDVGMDLNNQGIWLGVSQAVQMEALGYQYAEVVNDTLMQWLQCELVLKFADNADQATEDDFKSARSALKSHVSPDVYLMNFWDYVFLAIGWKKFAQAAALGAIDSTADCDCPEVYEPGLPPGDGVWFNGLLEKTGGIGTMTITRISADMRKVWVRWVVAAPGDQFTQFQGLAGLVCPTNITSVDIRYTGLYPVADWHGLPYDRWDDPHHPYYENVTNQTFEWLNQSSAKVEGRVTFDAGKPNAFNLNNAKTLPGDTREAGLTTDFELEIIAWA